MQTSQATVWPTPAAGRLDGPWEQGFYVHVPGAPRSKSNHRHDHAHRAQWAELKAYAEQVALAVRAARPRGWVPGDPAAPLAERPVIVCTLFARALLDAGNLDKSVLDAVSGTPARGRAPATAGVVMATDAQVAVTTSWVARAATEPGLLALFARLEPGAASRSVAAASIALTQACWDLISPA